MAVLQFLSQTCTDNGEVRDTIKVDDGVDSRGLVEIRAHIECDVLHLASSTIGILNLIQVARDANHRRPVATRRIAGNGNLGRVELVLVRLGLGAGLQEANARLDVLERSGEGHARTNAMLHGRNHVARLGERETRLEIARGIGTGEATAVDPHEERRLTVPCRGRRQQFDLEIDGSAVLARVKIRNDLLADGHILVLVNCLIELNHVVTIGVLE